jgi:hypothetical protein
VNSQLLVVIDFDLLLAPRGGIGDVELHGARLLVARIKTCSCELEKERARKEQQSISSRSRPARVAIRALEERSDQTASTLEYTPKPRKPPLSASRR